MGEKKDSKNIVIILLTVLLVVIAAINICFFISAKPSVKKEKITKQNVKQDIGENVTYSKDVDSFNVSQSSNIAEDSTNDDSNNDSDSDDNDDVDNNNDSEYILPDSDSRKLTKSDLKKLSKKQLRYARNELYARHGRIFDDEELDKYFRSKSWYVPSISGDDFNDEAEFNEYEIANRDLISKYEKSKK